MAGSMLNKESFDNFYQVKTIVDKGRPVYLRKCSEEIEHEPSHLSQDSVEHQDISPFEPDQQALPRSNKGKKDCDSIQAD